MNTEKIPKVVEIIVICLLCIGFIIFVMFLYSGEDITYRFYKVLYLPSAVIDQVISSNSYVEYITFNPKPYIGIDKNYTGFFKVIVENSSPSELIYFVVKDGSNTSLGEEVVVSTEKPTEIPFTVGTSSISTLKLYYKTTSSLLIMNSIEIYII